MSSKPIGSFFCFFLVLGFLVVGGGWLEEGDTTQFNWGLQLAWLVPTPQPRQPPHSNPTIMKHFFIKKEKITGRAWST